MSYKSVMYLKENIESQSQKIISGKYLWVKIKEVNNYEE